MALSTPGSLADFTINKIYKSGDVGVTQWQGTKNHKFTTIQYKDGSFSRSGYVGDMVIDDGKFESWLYSDSSAEIEFIAKYTPQATKTTKAGGEYLGNGVSAPIETTIETSSREEITVFRIPPGNNHPIFDHSEWEHTGTWEFLYSDYPNSDDSELDGKDTENPQVATSPTTNRSGLKKFNIEHLLPENWWENPFKIVGTKSDKSDNNSSNSDSSKELDPIKLPESFNKKSADKISNFNPSTDTLEIDTDSFDIDSSASFAAGKNKKTVKKVLAKQDFDFLYDQKKGGLYFNENGSDKGLGDGGIIAILKGAPELTSGNLEFV